MEVKMYKYIAALMMIALLLTGCGGRDDVPEGVTEIVFWHAMGGPLGEALNELVDEFNREHPEIHISMVNMGNYTALSQKLTAAIQAGNQPHIAQAFEAWTAYYQKGDVIVPFERFIENDPEFGEEDLEDFFPVFVESNTIDGELLSFPFNKSVRVLYYNRDLFFRHDLDPNQPPRTWDEFREYAKILTRDTTKDGSIDQYGTTIRISAWQFQNLLLQAGGRMMDEDYRKPLFNDEAGVRALEYLRTLLTEDKTAYLSPGYEGQRDFTASKVAMYEDTSVSYAFMERTGIPFNLGLAPIPIDKTRKNIISGTNVIIFKNEDDQVLDAAWEFVKWFTDTPQTAKWSAMTYYMPVRQSAMQEPELKQRIEETPGMADVYDQLNYATFEPQISEWFELRRYLEEHVIERVVRGRLQSKTALDNAAKRLTEMIAKQEVPEFAQ